MKKVLYLLTALLFWNVGNAQIRNLETLKRLSEFDASGLINATQYSGWELVRPTETIENGIARSTQKFIYDFEGEKQILKRTVVAFLREGYKYVNTILISNDYGIKKRILAELNPYEKEPSSNEYKNYDDGYKTYRITDDENTDYEFYEEFSEQGGFQISITEKLPL